MLRIWICLMLAVFLAIGCSKRPAGPQKPIVNYINHTVRFEGETLGLIARWYTRSTESWKEILAHNPGLDVYRIRQGQVIRVPDFLVRRDSPMPQEFVLSAHAASSTSESGSVPTEQAKEPEESILAPTPSADQAALQAENELSAEPLLQREPLGPPEKALPEAGRSEPMVEDAPTQLPTVIESITPPTEAPTVFVPPTATAIPRAKSRDELLRELLESPSGQ